MENKSISALINPNQSQTDAGGYAKPPVIQQLTIRPIYRRSQDIEKWRKALRAAEATIPRRVELYDLYDDILLDAHLRSVVEKRIMAVTNADWSFTDANGQEVEAVKKFIDTPEFEELLAQIIQSKLWGYSMIEFDFHADGTIGIFNIPRKHIRPDTGIITFEQSGNNGLDVRTGIYSETILEVGKEKDLGLLLSAAQYVIYKRGNFGDWAQFAEVFGMPMIDAVWDGYDESQRVLLLNALESMGSGGQIVRPAGTQLEFKQGGTNNPTGDLYNNLINACNAEMSKLILGQTETTESSSSSGYAQASVHAQTENDINRTDLAFVRRLLNRRVLDILQANGFAANGEFILRQDDSTGLTLEQQLNIELRLLNEAKLPISDNHFYEKYGIEKPDDYEAQKQKLEARAAAMQAPQFGLNDPLFLNAPQAKGAKIISLRDLYADCDCGCQTTETSLHGSIQLADNSLSENFIKKVFKGELKNGEIDADYYFRVGKLLTEAVMKGLGANTLQSGNAKTRLFEKLQNNIFGFSGAKSLALMQEYNKQLRDEDGNDRSYAQFRNAVIPIGDTFNDAYMQTEYNSAAAMAQAADKWDNLQAFEYLEYRTVGDNKVRKEHEDLDGVILEANDPLWDTIYPPNGWNCRCTVIPSNAKASVGRDRAAQVKGSNTIKPYFRRNVGTEQIVFKEDHPYFQRAAHDLKKNKQHQFMAEENYAMRPAEKIVLDSHLPELNTANTIEEAKANWEASNKKITTADGLEFNMSDAWEHVVKQNNENRWKYINHAKDVLESPDEVWSTREFEGNNKTVKILKRYVKYYNGQPVVFSYDIDKPDLWTIYQSNIDETGTFSSLRKDVRKGVLTYRK